MNKKGAASHVDWAISIGLFVVYTLLLFIFLRPGTEPVYSQSNLLTIIASSLNADYQYSIEKTPLFIRPNGNNFPSAAGEYQAEIRKANLAFDVDDAKNFSLQLVNGSDVKFEMGLSHSHNNDFLRLNSTFDGNNKDYIFVILYSNEHAYDSHLSQAAGAGLLLYDPPKNINFTYELGVKEVVTGFSSEKLAGHVDYAALKTAWKFPADRDFSVVVTDVVTGVKLKVVNDVVVPPNINVFANTYLDWLLYNNSTMVPVNVFIRVW
jgi:hypothetical protein